jgi:hypothetical protein
VVTTDKSPAGNHKTVFVEVVTSVAGEPVRMSGGRTELQITPPAPPAATVAAAPPPAPPPPAEKPLSRLEQLRQQAGRGGPRE